VRDRQKTIDHYSKEKVKERTQQNKEEKTERREFNLKKKKLEKCVQMESHCEMH
jgi:hypothetical protein